MGIWIFRESLSVLQMSVIGIIDIGTLFQLVLLSLRCILQCIYIGYLKPMWLPQEYSAMQ